MSAYENFHCTSNLGPSLVGPWKILTTNLDKRGLLTGEEVFRENKRHLQESHGSPNETFSLLENDKMYNHKSIS